MNVRVVQCGKYRLRVTSWGTGGPPHAIVLPGMSADGRALAPQIRALRREMGSVHVIDLPGFVLGPALAPSDASFTQLGGYVAKAADELGIERAVVLGHSLGGGVALYLAIDRPDLVDSLVLVAPAALGRSLHWIYKLYCIPLIGRALMRPQARMGKPFVRRFLVGSRRRVDQHFVDMLVRHGSAARDRALSARAICWANQPRIWRKVSLFFVPGGEQIGFALGERLKRLAGLPTLVLWGSEDRVICVRDAASIHHANPEARVHIVRGYGHMLPLEAPRWTNERVVEFVRSLRPRLRRVA